MKQKITKHNLEEIGNEILFECEKAVKKGEYKIDNFVQKRREELSYEGNRKISTYDFLKSLNGEYK